MDRRRFFFSLAGGAVGMQEASRLGFSKKEPSPRPSSLGDVFEVRGYYLTFMRMPWFTFSEWNEIYRYMKEDPCNLVILWMGGGFRSKKFPIAWKYNEDHRNIQKDFVRDLIDFGHSLAIRGR